MASEHWPTYVLLALYVCAMIIVTSIANYKNRKAKQGDINGDEINDTSQSHIDLNNDSTSNYNLVTTHFLASKNFGGFILLLTTFASVFSGYTIVGVPNEAGSSGFFAIRWVSCILAVAVSLLMIFPRLRRLSIVRHYSSPGDFVNDRYSSKLLCVLVTLCLCVPQLLYLAVQLLSLGAVLSSLTDGELSFYAVIVVATALILIFEAIGGMRSVAYTDAVQASVMIIIFITIPIVIGIQNGGFIGQVTDSDDLPCDNSKTIINDNDEEELTGCLNYASYIAPDGSDTVVDEYYLRSPSSITIVNYLLFTLSFLSFSLNPHVLQRSFTAKEDWQVRFVMICMFMAAFLAMIPGILTGITYISNKSDFKEEYQSFKAFPAMLAVFRDQGGFVSFISYVALLAGIAGIMSTADSALIGVSNTMSCDIFKNWLLPNASFNKIVWIGKAISFITMCICIGIAIYLFESDAEYGVIITLQQAILWQAFPAYIFGLYTDLGTNSILFGIIGGLICDIILISIVFTNDPFAKSDTAITLDKSWSSLVGVGLNLLICGISHAIYKYKNKQNNKKDDHEEIQNESEGTMEDEFHSQYGSLTPTKIKSIMVGIDEPLTKYHGIFVYLSLIIVIITAFHWIGETDPELEGVDGLLYDGYIRNVIAGLPDYTFASFIWYVISCIVGIYAASLWTVDSKYKDRNHVPTDSNISMGVVTTKINDDDINDKNNVDDKCNSIQTEQ